MFKKKNIFKTSTSGSPFLAYYFHCFLSEVHILQNIPTNWLLELVIKAISEPRAACFNFP